VAAEAVRSGRVRIGGHPVKASRLIGPGECLDVRKGIITNRYRVLQPLEKRVSAKLVPEYLEDITPEEELAKMRLHKEMPTAFRKPGRGRPTKRERREIDRWHDEE
jgi:ribosome-associated heat shock protein Hsp15